MGRTNKRQKKSNADTEIMMGVFALIVWKHVADCRRWRQTQLGILGVYQLVYCKSEANMVIMMGIVTLNTPRTLK